MILSGPTPVIRDWRSFPSTTDAQWAKFTVAEKVMFFIENHLRVPEGAHVGEPIHLLEFQELFVYAVYDNPVGTRKALLSIARKQGKTTLIAALVLAHICGPVAKKNSQVVSGAMSREQASLIYNAASKMALQSPDIMRVVKVGHSQKRLSSVTNGSEYRALSAEASTAYGLSPVVAVLDEIGQVRGPDSDFIQALTSSQGAHENPIIFAISTNAATDADLFSVWIDDAEISKDPHTVCHVYQADAECDLMDEEQWEKANPALGEFRSRKDLREQLKEASRIPSQEASARNLLLNQRIALQSLWLAPSVWGSGSDPVKNSLFYDHPVTIGIDLSSSKDLTAAVLAVEHRGIIYLKPFVFTPMDTVRTREASDKAPYSLWIRNKKLIALPGAIVNYRMVCEFLVGQTKGMGLLSVQFDRWRINEFKQAALEEGFGGSAEWVPVGQGFKDMSPRMELFEEKLLRGELRHGDHPLLRMSAANAIAMRDPSGNQKLSKKIKTARIDPLVAAVMAVFGCNQNSLSGWSPEAMIG